MRKSCSNMINFCQSNYTLKLTTMFTINKIRGNANGYLQPPSMTSPVTPTSSHSRPLQHPENIITIKTNKNKTIITENKEKPSPSDNIITQPWTWTKISTQIKYISTISIIPNTIIIIHKFQPLLNVSKCTRNTSSGTETSTPWRC